MQLNEQDYAHIKGWGIDADPQNDPTSRLRKRTGREHDGYSWSRPTQQPVTVEVLHSNERPHVTSVFGTSTPPSGVSGILRRFAFRYSESSYGHWLPLMLADRVGEVEGVLHDVSRGHVPNIFAELGWAAEWKYNRTSLLLRIAAGACVTAVLVRALRDKS
jgi:hypothetical protein